MAGRSKWLVGSSSSSRSGEGAKARGERGPPRLAAGEMGRVLISGEAEAIQQSGAAMLVVAGAEAGLHVIQRSFEAGQIRLLRQVADGGAGLEEAGAPIGLQHPGRDLQQGGLAGPVAANEANPLPGAHTDRRTIQQGLRPQRRMDILEEKKRGCHGGCLARACRDGKPDWLQARAPRR